MCGFGKAHIARAAKELRLTLCVAGPEKQFAEADVRRQVLLLCRASAFVYSLPTEFVVFRTGV